MQEHLLKICIKSPKSSEYEADSPYGEAPEAAEEVVDAAHRRLLAGGGEDPCPDGKVRCFDRTATCMWILGVEHGRLLWEGCHSADPNVQQTRA